MGIRGRRKQRSNGSALKKSLKSIRRWKVSYTGLVASEIEFVNLTEHDMCVGENLVIPKEPNPAKVYNDRTFDGVVDMGPMKDGIPIYRFLTSGRIAGLPGPKEGVVYIVSPYVRKELTQRGMERPDVVSPYVLERRMVGDRSMKCTMALAR
jgi:hypothetical protein